MSEDEVKQAMELLDRGKTYEEAALVVGVHSTTVIRKVRQYKIYGAWWPLRIQNESRGSAFLIAL